MPEFSKPACPTFFKIIYGLKLLTICKALKLHFEGGVVLSCEDGTLVSLAYQISIMAFTETRTVIACRKKD
jgi:hypothetical protein